MAGHDVTRLDRAPALVAARVPKVDGPRELGFLERTTLFVCAMHRERALELLEGLAEEPRARARAFARQVMDWDSSTRQARLSRELGARPDAVVRLRALMAEVPPALRAAVRAEAPDALKGYLPAAPNEALPSPTPAMRAVARRLVKEAIR